jgi:hypothetical protein
VPSTSIPFTARTGDTVTTGTSQGTLPEAGMTGITTLPYPTKAWKPAGQGADTPTPATSQPVSGGSVLVDPSSRGSSVPILAASGDQELPEGATGTPIAGAVALPVCPTCLRPQGTDGAESAKVAGASGGAEESYW